MRFSRITAILLTIHALLLGLALLAPPPWESTTLWVVGYGVLIGGGLLLTWLILRNYWSVPLRRVIHATRRMADEDALEPIHVRGEGEIAVLAHAINHLGRRFARRKAGTAQQLETLETLLEHLHEGVVVVDHEARVRWINPAAVRLLHLRTDAGTGLIGAPLEGCIPHHAVQRILHTDRRSENGDDRVLPDGRAEENIVIEADGRDIHLFARASDLRLPGTESEGVSRLLVLTDITELSEALQMKADFVANASHELRTPLSTIRVAVETLLHMDLASEVTEARMFLEKVDRHSARLVEMVSDLLDLSRVESASFERVAREIVPGDFLDDVHDRFLQRIMEGELQWVPIVADPGWRFSASPYLLQLIVHNLVDNAIKFSEPGGPIRVSMALREGLVHIEVADEGCGIPEADRRRVFERFYQVERSRASEPRRGTGLGLAIVKNATVALGGTIALESRVGAGTRVSLSFPESQPAEASA